jgi:hypothetical protein
MTGRPDDAGRALRSLLLEETNAMPVDAQQAAIRLRRRIAETRTRRRVTLAVAASVVAAVAVTVAGGWLGVNKAAGPAQNPDQSVTVAREFVDAVGRFDADAAISYLTNDAIVQGDEIAAGADAAEELRLTLAHYRATRYKQTINDCVQVGTSAAGVNVSCAFDVQAIRSDEIGLGPYTGNYWRLTIRDGKIVSAQQAIAIQTNGFAEQVWAPSLLEGCGRAVASSIALSAAHPAPQGLADGAGSGLKLLQLPPKAVIAGNLLTADHDHPGV